MKAKLLIVMMMCLGMLTGCCGMDNYASNGGSCGGSSCSSGTSTYSNIDTGCSGGSCGRSSYRDTMSYCGDACNGNGCCSFFGNIATVDPYAQNRI